MAEGRVTLVRCWDSAILRHALATTLWVGLGGAARNGCAALCTSDRVLGVCEQERVTRVRAAGFNLNGLPDEALDELLRRCGRTRDEVAQYALGEPAAALDSDPRVLRLDHHFAHACAAFLTSPFETATIVVCDHQPPEVSVWEGTGGAITRVEWPWHGPGFAAVYSQCAQALGFAASAQEQRMEALARLEPAPRDARATPLFDFGTERLLLARNWQARIDGWLQAGTAAGGGPQAVAVAAALQARIGDLLLEFLAAVRHRNGTTGRLCVAGSLFYNSCFNARVRSAGLFDQVFVPINPGNAGLAVGAALHASGNARRPVTPFLGPSYDPEETKATLDNCKLNYVWMSEADTIAVSVDALRQGRLVGWFDGPMEWGPRALGGRSIVANPFAPHVLENLNRFLKHRDPWRGYALSGLEDAVRQHFEGPDTAPFMECDYVPKDRARFRHVLPSPSAAIRVHSAGGRAPMRFRNLLRAFGEATGVPILVNTSFNGFREPIVCSPRDAVRVFFGTGLDLLVLGQFVISK